MDRSVKKSVVAIISMLLVIAITASAVFVKPHKVSAARSTKVDGMVIWGTSGVSRMYGDMNAEQYTTEDDPVMGSSETAEHVWASYTSDNGAGYGYLDVGLFASHSTHNGHSYGYGQISDAPNYATLSNSGSTNMSGSQQKPLSSIMDDGISAAVSRGWDPTKIALVIWAGEDWVVRNAESSDAGLPVDNPNSPKWLQVDWMGLGLVNDSHMFDPAPGANSMDPHGDVMHGYCDDMGTSDMSRVDEILGLSGHYGVGGGETSDCGNENPDVTTCARLSGSSSRAFSHSYVFNNSYLITEEHLGLWVDDGTGHMASNSGFSYTAENDGLDLTLEHKLNSTTDAFPDFDLSRQASTCFARMLSGYTYSVEYLVQNTEQWWSEDPGEDNYQVNHSQTVTYWRNNGYIEAHDDALPDEVTTYWSENDDEARTTVEEITYGTNPERPATKTTTIEATGEEKDEGEGEDAVHYYEYKKTISVVVHYPGHYEWEQVTEEVDYRCDADKAPNAGYADSWHIHKYGGLHGVGSAEGDDELDHGAEHWIGGEYAGGDGSEADHSGDYTDVVMWYTNPDKPIMKVVTETRRVTGYIERWRQAYPQLMIYVFGIGPYSKAQYDDQKDECWTDNSEWDNAYTASISGIDPAYTLAMADHRPTHEGSWTTSGIDEIRRTDRINNARMYFNSSLQSQLTGAKFIDMWTLLAEHRPYFRYKDIVTIHSSSASGANDAQHGKWYDKNTYNWIFHTMWSTVLADNPEPIAEAPVGVNLYAMSSALTGFATTVVSAEGRSGEDVDNEILHALPEIGSLGMSGAGAALGYGDTSYGFNNGGYISVSASNSVTTAYSAVFGVGSTGSSTDITNRNGVYMYARYGHLLKDLGLDDTALESAVSPRIVPGLLMYGAYGVNSVLGLMWNASLEILRTLNPFQFLYDASSLSDALKVKMLGGEADEIPDRYVLIKWASENNTGVAARILGFVGEVYDGLTGWDVDTYEYGVFDEDENGAYGVNNRVRTGSTHFSVLFIYTALLIAGLLLFFNVWDKKKKWGKVKLYLIRFVFILVGIPFLGIAYTAVLNNAYEMTKVTSAPSSQLIAGTFVDFAGWVKETRLDPPDGVTFESVSKGGDNDPGMKSSDNFSSIRSIAWKINEKTGCLADVDMTIFGSALDDPLEWNSHGFVEEDTSTWAVNTSAMRECFELLSRWMNGDFYTAAMFESDTLGYLSRSAPTRIGGRAGVDSEGNPVQVDNSNTFYQMLSETDNATDWMGRSVDENTDILLGRGDYGSMTDAGTNWDIFNVFANGRMLAWPGTDSVGGVKISYRSNGIDSDGSSPAGLSIGTKTGLSTLSMYNYLQTDFGDSTITVYSSPKSMNRYTAMNHYQVNIVGTGFLRILFYLNCFLFMFVVSIVGLVYCLGMVISILKKSFRLLFNIPGSMLGFARSIYAIVAVVASMIIEIVLSMVLYGFVSEVLLTLMTLIESPIRNLAEGGNSVEGLALLGQISNAGGSFVFSMFGILVALILVSVLLIKGVKGYFRVFSKAYDCVALKAISGVPGWAEGYLYGRKRYGSRTFVPVRTAVILKQLYS